MPANLHRKPASTSFPTRRISRVSLFVLSIGRQSVLTHSLTIPACWLDRWTHTESTVNHKLIRKSTFPQERKSPEMKILKMVLESKPRLSLTLLYETISSHRVANSECSSAILPSDGRSYLRSGLSLEELDPSSPRRGSKDWPLTDHRQASAK